MGADGTNFDESQPQSLRSPQAMVAVFLPWVTPLLFARLLVQEKGMCEKQLRMAMTDYVSRGQRDNNNALVETEEEEAGMTREYKNFKQRSHTRSRVISSLTSTPDPQY